MNPETDAAIAPLGVASPKARSSPVRIDAAGHARADAHAVVDDKAGGYADIDEEGWLAGGERRPSPSQDARPPGTPIDLLVIHNISLPPGDFSGDWIDDLFLDRLDPAAHPYFREIAGLRVSAHLLIRRNGRLLQYVPFEQRAWHAGVSRFAGRGRCNDFSIGIELEGTDDIPFTEAQYARLAECTRRILRRYPGITEDRIAGHAEIAPGRKTDPGPAFDWNRYRRSIRSEGRAVDPDPPSE
ncbi:MAG: 1,6-anhydro-N-acetylmuramyl-L-alanine amidase AmpD [Thiocapsa sp.]|uniref:1,6-anhydro-N-acetylmuramyl-L-alanine amidase AmpD n=1 Tax=Thiocapsa sp. TaxID=2024551 RepID=UPI001BD00991|nr:1,6-anhydro-N-acetylmuramyl-L-alanine amidase AmpD [Thiocapsa sp.]QVL46840.1 MAG: 1,6-anhydro-N-acetylmuramyl-L-alanine amidase AmpD [Thiocapsa sp.]